MRSSTVLMLDVSMSMAMRDNFLPAKKVTMALHSLISSQYPRDFLGMVSFSEVAREFNAATLPELSWDYVYGTNMQHSFQIARKMLSKQAGTKQIIMITDGEPTAHITPSGQPYFNYRRRRRRLISPSPRLRSALVRTFGSTRSFSTSPTISRISWSRSPK